MQVLSRAAQTRARDFIFEHGRVLEQAKYEEVSARWRGFLSNPGAEIVGYLHDYPRLVPAELRDALLHAAISHLEAQGTSLEMHDILCTLRLAESKGLPAGARQTLVNLLTPVVDRAVVRDPARWGDYGLMPVEVVYSPDALFAPMLADVVSANLDYEIAQHAENGIWRPRWDWSGMVPEAWEQARKDWTGWLTMRMLTILKNFGRLEA